MTDTIKHFLMYFLWSYLCILSNLWHFISSDIKSFFRSYYSSSFFNIISPNLAPSASFRCKRKAKNWSEEKVAEPTQTPKMELFAKIVNGCDYFRKKKKSILDVWLGFVQFSEIITWTWTKQYVPAQITDLLNLE